MVPGAELSEADKIAEMAKYDLTQRLSPYFDRHLMFPIFHSLRELGIYKPEDLTRAEVSLLGQTNMIDFAIEQYAAMGEEPPKDLAVKREKVLEVLEASRLKVFPLLEVLENAEKVEKIKNFKSIADMETEFNIDAEVIDQLVTYARLQFDCGNYALSCDLLKHYQSIMAKDSENAGNSSRAVSSSWGYLVSLILNTEFEAAAEVIYKIDDFLDQSKLTKEQVLLHRTWLLHWTLFVIFKATTVQSKLIDFFLNEKSMSIISLSCPHLFRYVSACLILQKPLKHLVKDSVKVMNNEQHNYADPVTRFLGALYTDMDFDQAQVELQKCELVCRGDYFLGQHWHDFQENARLLIFETYCRIHQCINIKMVASKLGMGAEEAELWIVKLIQSAKLDARIDSEKSRVVMSKAPPSVYQQVIERTKNLSFRSTMLVSNLDKKDKVGAKI